MRLASVALLLATLGVACRPDTVDLTYRLDPDSVLRYEMVASADASWDIEGRGEGSYEVTFEITEAVRSVDEEGAVVSVVMDPVDVKEEVLLSPGPRERSFTLRVGPDGQVLEVVEVDGVPAEALEPDELAFIGTYRPPLPLEPVRLRDSWPAAQQLQVGSVFQQVASTGHLDALDVDGAAKVAELSYSGSGPLVWTTTLPQGAAELTGAADSTSTAEFDIEGGVLRSATSSTQGRFEVRVVPEQGQAPLTGTLRLDLELELTAL